MKRILIVEDEAALAAALVTMVERSGHAAVTAASAARGLDRLAAERFDLVLLDIGLPDQSGLQVLQAIRARDADLPVLVITAHGSLQNAVLAKQQGASGYLVKPLDLAELGSTVRALLHVDQAPEVRAAPMATPGPAPLLIGSAPAMQPAFAAIAHACAADVPVLITGPTGIGKSLAARIVHLHSPRQRGPFVTLSCASLPAALLEAELFGHERGAFTGADAARIGHVERAAGGTLFLDEIGEVPPAVQVKLLRVVEEKVFTRVGGREDKQVDLRIVAATNQDLAKAVAEGRFREDLMYRLRVLEVKLPSLAERISDLPALCAYFLSEIGGERRLAIADEALALLRRHSWPGNVRELRNVLEHAVAVAGGTTILAAHLPLELRRAAAEGQPAAADGGQLDRALHEWLDHQLRSGSTYDTIHDELERRLLAALLPRFGGKPTRLARELDVHRATLRKKLRAYGFRPDVDDS